MEKKEDAHPRAGDEEEEEKEKEKEKEEEKERERERERDVYRTSSPLVIHIQRGQNQLQHSLAKRYRK